ncbi:hypothetical protein [Pseudoclavibacter sp. Z016]|uniref:hypothetical protein n=1 Tax=Pseudoclavibacter sp. Z016 TaxID=2080581 RepID=UPI0015E38FF5|nr:hypothetical protein [Pseudoclavibacter sp. Z016]
MSKLSQLLTPKLPPEMSIPEPLERAWTWMEAQGWGFENKHGYFLTPYAGTAELGITFSPTETLTGWFEPGENGHDRLFPLGQTDGTGGFAALWRDPSDEVRVVVLGSEGERLFAADDAVDFLRLLAIGYLELNSYSIGEAPIDEDAESVAALAEFRAWVEQEFDVSVPPEWSVREPDPFDAWVGEVKGEELEVPAGGPAPEPDTTPFILPSVDIDAVVSACRKLLHEPRIDGIRFRRLDGLRLTTAAWGHELEIITGREPTGLDEETTLASLMSDVRSAFIAAWGAPRAEAPAKDSWAANKLVVTSIEHVDLWPVGDDLFVALFTSATEGMQIAAVVSASAVDEPANY